MSKPSLFVLIVGLMFQTGNPVYGQQDWDAVEIQVTPLRGGVLMITAGGGSLAAFAGPDGVLMVDADYAELSERIVAAVGEAAAAAEGWDPALRYLVNTHWHFDHTSGNENFVRAGATLIAHEGVSRLLAADQVMNALGGREVPAAPILARPTLTFNDRMSLNFNEDVIHLVHMADAHTDGDLIVHFRDADVIHMGDLFFNGMYPFIDIDNGGNLPGMVRALEEVLAHSGETTLFIPGHGPLAERGELQAYADMLRTVRDRVRGLMDEGKTRDEVIAEKPTADFDAVWSGESSFLEPDRWVGLVYDGMASRDLGGKTP